MIHFTFALYNPFSRRDHRSKTLYTRLFGYKTFDIEYTRDNAILEFWLRYTIRESHAGIILSLSLLSYGISITLDDVRHWNRVTNDWEKFDDYEGC